MLVHQLFTNGYITGLCVVILILALAVGIQQVRSDYRKWIVFGQGKPPYTEDLYGYLVFTVYRYLLRAVRFDGISVHSLKRCSDQSTFLSDKFLSIENRKGERPILVPWILPQRIAPPYSHDLLVEKAIRELLSDVVKEWSQPMNPSFYEIVELGTSRLDGPGDAIHLHKDLPNIHQDVKLLMNEVAHIHRQDLSMHVILSPADAAAVIEKKYGERFGIAGKRMYTGTLKGSILPLGYTLVYTPRTLEEVGVIKEIIKAAIRFGLSG